MKRVKNCRTHCAALLLCTTLKMQDRVSSRTRVSARTRYMFVTTARPRTQIESAPFVSVQSAEPTACTSAPTSATGDHPASFPATLPVAKMHSPRGFCCKARPKSHHWGGSCIRSCHRRKQDPAGQYKANVVGPKLWHKGGQHAATSCGVQCSRGAAPWDNAEHVHYATVIRCAAAACTAGSRIATKLHPQQQRSREEEAQ